MVQILNSPQPLDNFKKGLGDISDALAPYMERKREKRGREEESQALETAGFDVPGAVRNPKIREALLEQQIGNRKGVANVEQDQQRTEAINKYFGPEAAEIYPHLTEGGKTKLFESLLEGKMRGFDTNQVLGNYIQENIDEFQPQSDQPRAQQQTRQQGKPNLSRQPAEVGLLPKEIVKSRQEETKFKREHETKRSEKILEEAYDSSKNFDIQQSNIDMIKNAVEDVSGFDQDYIAELFHYEPFRTAKGTQLKSAGKDLFIKTIQGTGNRPNQWIEQQIGSALTQVGKTREANLTVAEMAQFQLDLSKEKVRIINELEDKYEQELGYIPGKIGREAEEILKPYAAQRQDELAYDLRKVYEREQGPKKLSEVKKVPKGTPLTIEMAQILLQKSGDDEEKAARLAKEMGFTIPPESIYQRASQ